MTRADLIAKALTDEVLRAAYNARNDAYDSEIIDVRDMPEVARKKGQTAMRAVLAAHLDQTLPPFAPVENDGSDRDVIVAIRTELWDALKGREMGGDRTLIGMVKRLRAERDAAQENRRGEFDLRMQAEWRQRQSQAPAGPAEAAPRPEPPARCSCGHEPHEGKACWKVVGAQGREPVYCYCGRTSAPAPVPSFTAHELQAEATRRYAQGRHRLWRMLTYAAALQREKEQRT